MPKLTSLSSFFIRAFSVLSVFVLRPKRHLGLSPGDCLLLRALARVVPAPEREDWTRTWQAELWHRRPSSPSLTLGMGRDAAWLRGDALRRACAGTPILCLATLVALCLLAAVAPLAMHPALGAQFRRSLWAAPLVLFVALATASRRHVEDTSRPVQTLKRHAFFLLKSAHVLLLAFLNSADLALPLRAAHAITADYLQMFVFVLFALVGLRWALLDGERRCKHCLNTFAAAARKGRPSHNLLEWNGTELTCRHGHGLLSVPEHETSWCQSSHWVDLNPA